MNGNLNMNNNQVTSLSEPQADQDACTKKYCDDLTMLMVQIDNPFIRSDLNARDNTITNLKAPTNEKDAASKKYIDDEVNKCFRKDEIKILI